ncbi:MAG: hypothetical protein F6K19_05130 [Cyanothece sp. SIO1E1]|nr:hypothetical protein [Cyanothece sp. SIO1E1]
MKEKNFPDYYKQQPQDQQGSLLPQEPGEIVIDTIEPNRKLAYNQLQSEVSKRSDSQKTHAVVNKIASQEMLGGTPDEIYEALGISKNDRSKLPTEAKQALMVGDIAAFQQIIMDDAYGHNPVVQAARKGYQNAAKLFGWNN